MKPLFTILSLLIPVLLFSQKEVYKKTAEGDLYIVYHSNGKRSTETLISNKSEYFAQGYSRAWNNKGDLIYEKPVSKTAMISSVIYSYYENGAVKKAEFNSHPDAGIQWYRQYTFFNEDGTISGVTEDSHDNKVTVPEEFRITEVNKPVTVKPVNTDSLQFYSEYEKCSDKTGILETKKSYPLKGFYEITWKKKNTLLINKIVFYKPSGIFYIEREYYKNGVMKTEKIFEKSVYHLKEFGKKGDLKKEEFNIPYIYFEF